MNDLRERLKRKGWSDEDIYKAIEIIEKGKKKKPKNIAFLDSIVYWLILFVALIGNFIISIILIPFMLAMQGTRLYIIILIIGFAFGAFFDLLIRDLKKVENKEVIIAGIFLPVLALINVIFMVRFSNYFQQMLGLGAAENNPIIVAVVYVFAFVLPYAIRSLMSYRMIKTNYA